MDLKKEIKYIIDECSRIDCTSCIGCEVKYEERCSTIIDLFCRYVDAIENTITVSYQYDSGFRDAKGKIIRELRIDKYNNVVHLSATSASPKPELEPNGDIPAPSCTK